MAQHDQQRWILVGGLGLTASLGLLHLLSTGLSQWAEGVSLPLFALILGGWWWQRQRSFPAPSPQAEIQTYDRAVVEQAWRIVDTQLEHLEGELPDREQPALQAYQTQRQALSADLERQGLTLAITGSKHTGKTSLAAILQSSWSHSIKEVPLSDTAALLASDAVVVLTGGDLTQSELNALMPLADHPGVVVAVNKRDQYLPDALSIVVSQVEAHLQTHLPRYAIPVVTIASQPSPVKRRKMQADGTWQEQWQPSEPNLMELWPQLQRLESLAPSLICATTYRQTQDFKQQLHHHLNQVRRQEALKLIQKAQGIAAIATGVNPIPALDLLATFAVNGQLVVDLAHLYRQPLNLKDGETVAKTLATLLVKLGLVELSTQMLTPLLKAHHATYLAGAVLQGMSAAYLTRIAGLAIVDYLESLEPGTQVNSSDWLNRLPQLLQSSFQRLQAQDCRPWLTQTLQSLRLNEG
ncbi:MAG: YcjF family protein [Prochlorotrichaceae cyanobacterium]